jgi:hypothetical protein
MYCAHLERVLHGGGASQVLGQAGVGGGVPGRHLAEQQGGRGAGALLQRLPVPVPGQLRLRPALGITAQPETERGTLSHQLTKA